jgi:hypothetical protein
MPRAGWPLALVQNAAVGLADGMPTNPVEGRLLQDSTGAMYLYHDGLKCAVQVAHVGDHVIQAIPTALSRPVERLVRWLDSGDAFSPPHWRGARSETTRAVERGHVPTRDRLRNSRGLKRAETGQRFLDGYAAARHLRRGGAPGAGHVVRGPAPYARVRDVSRPRWTSWLRDNRPRTGRRTWSIYRRRRAGTLCRRLAETGSYCGRAALGSEMDPESCQPLKPHSTSTSGTPSGPVPSPLGGSNNIDRLAVAG